MPKVEQQLRTMLEMQNRMNQKVHPDWIAQNFEWYRALWIECGELIEHYGYKWWKHQEPDMEQVRLEIVDIWHFGMSMCFDEQTGPADIAESMAAELAEGGVATLPMLEAVEALAGQVLVDRMFSVRSFWSMLAAAGMGLDDLYRSYVGKNVLNFFRQDHGYKDGSYRKLWAGREDNEHLAELLAHMDSEEEGFPERLYSALKKLYEKG